MSTTIRLKRCGGKKKPFYHLIVTDSRSPRDSSFIEKIGTYDPRQEDLEKQCSVKKEKALEWLKKGAEISDSVKGIFSRIGLTTN